MTTTTRTARPDHLVTLADGRHVAVDEHGAAGGPVVTLLHSAPGSRLLDPDPAATTASGVRLLTLDRAGYGDSSAPAPGDPPSVAARADEVAAALADLGVTETALVGWSHGGHVALALAARHPDLVRSVALVGTPAPDEEVPWLLEDQRAMLPALRADPAAAYTGLLAMLAPVASDPDELRANAVVGEADEAVYRSTREAHDRYLSGAVRQGAAGMAADITAMSVVPWGFDPQAVGAPVHLFYGDADVIVGPEHGRWWRDRLVDATLHPVAGGGHLLIVPRWAAVLAALAGR